jgi:hypothetical protein
MGKDLNEIRTELLDAIEGLLSRYNNGFWIHQQVEKAALAVTQAEGEEEFIMLTAQRLCRQGNGAVTTLIFGEDLALEARLREEQIQEGKRNFEPASQIPVIHNIAATVFNGSYSKKTTAPVVQESHSSDSSSSSKILSARVPSRLLEPLPASHKGEMV